MNSFNIAAINAFKDNYIWALVHSTTKTALVVDPGEAQPVIDFLEARHLSLQAILITHHHADHRGGIPILAKKYSPVIYGPQHADINPTVIIDTVTHLDIPLFGKFNVVRIPGHTLEHTAYYHETGLLFSGDTLFSAGCGRVFEGTYEQMYHSLLKLSSFPDDTKIYFKVIVQKTVLDQWVQTCQVVKKLKLSSYLNTSNMHVFDEKCIIRKVNSPEEIIYRFYKVRKQHYITRKKWLLEKYEAESDLLESKIRFIQLVITEQIIIFHKKKDFIMKQITKFDEIKPFVKVNESWEYLLDLKIHMFTEEKIKELEEKIQKVTIELETLRSTSIETLWINELTLLFKN
jgi:ribonuclease BN (tRNA processing enzyme)